MYTGIKRKQAFKFEFKMPYKCQMITLEEKEVNGVIRQVYTIKTHNFERDPNITWRDFEVSNLKAAGIDVTTQPEVKMTPSKEKINSNAESALNIMEETQTLEEIHQIIESNE